MEDSEVEEDVPEVFVIDESAVDEHDEGLTAELRDVAEDAADVVVFHGRAERGGECGAGAGKINPDWRVGLVGAGGGGQRVKTGEGGEVCP